MVAEEKPPSSKMTPWGPKADDADNAFRAVHENHWLDGGLTSATFKTGNPFSVFLQSGLDKNASFDEAGKTCVLLLEEGDLGAIDSSSAIVAFNCGEADALGFATHIARSRLLR
ncbi:MAG: hypothetical protein V3V20_08015 [Algisphaera sp.]